MSKLKKILIVALVAWMCLLTISQWNHIQDDTVIAFAMVDGVAVYMIDVTYVPTLDIPDTLVSQLAKSAPHLEASDVDWIIWRTGDF